MSPALLTSVFGIGEKLINHFFPDKGDQEVRKVELLALLQSGQMKELDAAMQVIVAEAKSEHWIAATWRPITMLTFVLIIANNYIIAPYMGAMFGTSVSLAIPPDMWDLLKIGLGGYVMGRSAEKGIKIWKSAPGE